MKKYKFVNVLIALFSACVISIVLATSASGSPKTPAAQQSSNGDGRLLVTRSPTMGTGVFASISIDGKRVMSMGMGKKYDAPISAGKHVLSVILDPNLNAQQPFTMPLEVVGGKTYGFTIVWKGGLVTLRRSQ